jgi:putative ABC transport system permease protein
MTREPFWRRYDRFWGRNRKADTNDELTFHYEMLVRDNIERGMDDAAARRAADERIGGVDQALEKCAAQDDSYARKDHRREWFGELRQDLAYGTRTLMRAPTFAVVAVLTLAIGIGATTAMFTVVNRVLLASLPFPNADRLVRIYEQAPEGRNDRNPVSAGNYIDWSTRTRSFSTIGAYTLAGPTALTGDGDPTQVVTRAVTPSYFAAYGVRPLLGRAFVPQDTDAGGAVVITEGLWRRMFGGDSSAVGHTITLNGSAATIVGVLPASAGDGIVDAWQAVGSRGLDPTQRKSHNYTVVARLAPGVSLEQAQAEMTGLARAIAADHPEFMKGWGVSIRPLHDDIVGGVRSLLLVLTAAVVVVLLIACGNLANLLLARAIAREREMVVRGALGAGRARLVRQLLTESLIVVVVGGTLGVVGAAMSLDVLLKLAPPIPLASEAHVNGTVIAFALGLTVFCTLLFGLAPALRLSRIDLQRTLRAATGSSGSAGHTRVRGALLTTQIALSVVLLVSAGLLVRSFRNLSTTDVGIRTEGLSVMNIDLPRSRYQDIPHQVQFYDALLERVSHLPGVVGVAGTTVAPTGGTSTWSFAIEGRPSARPSGREDPLPIHFVSGDYAGVLGVPLKQGRTLDAHDRADAPPVVMINKALARLHWPHDNPVGKRISLTGQQGPWIEIVGVIGDTRMGSPDSTATPVMYMPYAQKTFSWLSWMSVVVRTDHDVDPTTLIPSLRAAVWESDRLLPVQEFTRIIDLYRATIAPRRFAMALVTGFGLVALLLCVIGLYGLISYNVAQQRREIGVRIALGASEGEIVGSVVLRSARLAIVGVLAGLLGAFASTRLLSGQLYGVSAIDGATFAFTGLTVVAVAIVAAWIPALRAAKTSPLTALRA